MPEPVVEKPDIPPEYRNPTQRLDWDGCRAQARERHGVLDREHQARWAPHVIPRDGMWLDGGLDYGG